MPEIETWRRPPTAVRDHLVDRMRDRNISIDDLNQLRIWIESRPEAPEGHWYKDFGSFKLCGEGKYPKTFLLRGQSATGENSKRGSDERILQMRVLKSALVGVLAAIAASV